MHLPCLYGCADLGGMDKDDMCCLCYTESLSQAPCVQLSCGHIFHVECLRSQLNSRWTGTAINFGFAQCCLCRQDMETPLLQELLAPVRELQEKTNRLAAEYIELEMDEEIREALSEGEFRDDPVGLAMRRFNFYQCHKCSEPYFGGNRRCGEAAPSNFDPSELLCSNCVLGDSGKCSIHGRDFIEFKCRYCCDIACWFCFGSTHFCERCHNTNTGGETMFPCVGESCPLGGNHPPAGTEFSVGCSVCRKSRGHRS